MEKDNGRLPEKATEKVELAGDSPGVSTFQGTPGRGGWIPILAQRGNERAFRIDWLCPVCKRLTGNYRTCPKCGLEVLACPTRKDELPKRSKVFQYKRWIKNIDK